VFTRQGWQKDQMVVVVYEGDREMTQRADVDSIWARLFRMELRAMGVEVRDHLA
jgi:NADPH-dependent 2,4-dienoyl-CoA reductase/sulfur reductase-like enzyme